MVMLIGCNSAMAFVFSVNIIIIIIIIIIIYTELIYRSLLALFSDNRSLA